MLEIAVGAATAGAAVIGAIWRIHTAVVRKTTEHEKRLNAIENKNEIQEIKIRNIESNHSAIDYRVQRVEDSLNDIRVTIAEILQILKGGNHGKNSTLDQ